MILVNSFDEEMGTMEKMEAHEKGLLHRAFSIVIFNKNQHMLLQRRAATKYHSANLWTNACCSHPRPGELTEHAATRRLYEELGFTTDLLKIFDFKYKAPFDNGLTEHEFDHVFAGSYNGSINPNATEVQDFCFVSMDDLAVDLQSHPEKYTAWFVIAFPRVMDWFNAKQQ